jgi:hypothetical protein
LRKALIGAMIGALVFTAVAVAATQQNTITYTSTVKYKGKASKKKPKNTLYNGILAVRTSDQKQPNTAPLTEVFFAKQLKRNSAKFKSCKKSDFDAQPTIPAKCKKATVGGGSAKALVGKPGNPTTGPTPPASLQVPLKVQAINGPKGKTLFLAVNGGVATGNAWRAIPGKIVKQKGKFGFKVQFRVPPELQSPAPGSQVALTDFNVKVKTGRTVKIKKKKASYLQMTSCPKSKKLPTKVIGHFNQDDNSPGGGTKTDTGTMACH